MPPTSASSTRSNWAPEPGRTAQPMYLAKVIGDVVATRKDERLQGLKLLILQPLTADRQPQGRALVAADSVGAGVGEEVFFVRGKEASFPFVPGETPVDAGIVGIVNYWDHKSRADR